MKSFRVILKVTGCYTCPYSTTTDWCTKYRDEYLGEPNQDTPEQLYRANVYKLTGTCPMIKEKCK